MTLGVFVICRCTINKVSHKSTVSKLFWKRRAYRKIRLIKPKDGDKKVDKHDGGGEDVDEEHY